MGYDDRLNGAIAAQRACYADNASNAEAGSLLGAGQEPKLRERLYEIEKLLSDSTTTIRDSADRLFGAQMLKGYANEASTPDVAEPPISTVVNRILNLTRSNREEASRLNRIG